ncbi:MAG: (2Fe-2S) ferredoxin domain-containing protein [Timaviella obliquedivisa GSE-PSE-MK23-08B]|jgi:(2Fe-2S) ferredoxin|nr:(2Fe-2S) ferredoxin domain-containing protein [Timaviella obliquedivisa GSE-PSE-MK23-08B]
MGISEPHHCVLVCQYHSCARNRAAKVLEAFQLAVPLGVLVTASGCLGQCSSGSTVYITPDRTWYCRVKPEDVAEIVAQHLQLNQPVARLLHPRFHHAN